MSKIIILVGISNSGKSTYTAEKVQSNPQKYISVNRDKIRELLFSYTEETISKYYNRSDFNKCEKQVTKYEDTLINEGLCEGKTVIIDATHLSKDYILRHKFWNALIDITWFDITLKEALTRNMGRNRKVDEEIIKKQYNKYCQLRRYYLVDTIAPLELINDSTLPHCVLLDIDGTVAHMTNRSAFDWKRVGEDYVDTTVKKISNVIVKGHIAGVFICTGRDGSCLEDTQKWLDDNNVYYDKIFIRKAGDMRPDWEVKEEIWRQIAKDYYILALIDDRNQVVRRARSLGLKVLQVEYGNF